jgi:arabinofuranosyltransferase
VLIVKRNFRIIITMKTVKLTIGILSVTACLTFSYLLWSNYEIADDAVITYRFAWNMIRGYGIVPYPGGLPLEGYSNPLQFFLVSFLSLISGTSDIFVICWIGRYIGIISGILILFLAAIWSRMEQQKPSYIFLMMVAVATFQPFITETQTALETSSYTLTVFAMAFGFARGIWSLAYLSSICVALGRPEGILLSVAAWTIHFLRKDNGGFSKRNRFFHFCLYLIIPYFLFLTWRFHYFGSLVSTSTIAKTYFQQRGVFKFEGVFYLFRSLINAPLPVLLWIATIYRIKSSIRTTLYESAIILAQLFFIFAVGGDEFYFGHHRFIFPLWPFLFRSIPNMLGRMEEIFKGRP